MAGTTLQRFDCRTNDEDPTSSREHPLDAAPAHPSHTALKSSIIPPRDIFDALPEPLLHYLHEELDRARLRQVRVVDPRLAQIESLLIERLFPVEDRRCFVVKLRVHGQATAAAARIVAEAVGLPPDMTYLCGWLHDIGIASCLRHAEEVFPVTDDTAFEGLEPTLQRSEVAHCIRLSTFWRLPSGIRYAIRDHVSFSMLTRPILIAAATVIAEHAVNRCGILPHRAAMMRPRVLQQAGERLGLGEQAVGKLVDTVVSQLAAYELAYHDLAEA